jgi:nematocidal protein AidA
MVIMTKVSSPILGTQVQGRITINVMTVMDVVSILAANPKLSQDPLNPTPIGHGFIWMVSDDARGWSTNGDPANIQLNAHVGDTLSFFCSGVTDNSETAAFIYQIAGGVPVLNPSTVNIMTLQRAAQPTAPTGYPAALNKASFASCDAKVAQVGTAQNFWMRAALFTLDPTGEQQVLAGYVGWDPTVVVA